MRQSPLPKASLQSTSTGHEAALYDRQIRLWGLEAQQRMRNAAIMIIRLNGVATEVIKNIVLAGIGRLVVVDPAVVRPEDLGASFFYRDQDVGSKRVEAAKPHIESLNPLVAVDVVSDPNALSDDAVLESLINSVDLVILTDSDHQTALRVNACTRRLNKPFYAGGSYGLMGYVFVDLVSHEYVTSQKASDPNAPPKTVKNTTTYNSLENALTFSWAKYKKRQTREAQPALVFGILSLWEYQSKHGSLPDSPAAADELEQVANAKMKSAGVLSSVVPKIPRELAETIATTAAHEFSPVCAVLGGLLAQDVLKALGRRDPPMDNFFVFDGMTGQGSVLSMRQ
ncbi:hypothetical protein EXIGLDRAFT_712313 [Exidia glandulosa HHB12029]|uniref:Ubiquitin-like 1-activating enzyme E1A n=1 Tax=Exidia glandulosa HHB12029 TaxID=1314781 RepID=A0A165Q8J8_EXIGL|nr:hypothetical protein EXIGLDRAFT_712313 [Exidia glandulosa HHB12029]